MGIDAYIEAVRFHGASMAEAAEAAGPDTAIPTCPDWVMRDLIRHTGGVHRWATGIVVGALTDPRKASNAEIVGSWPHDDDLIGWFRSGVDDLVAAISGAPDNLECWTFMPAPTPRMFWARRQAHETAIHHADARIPVSGAPQYDQGLAADGIDELLIASLSRSGRGPRAGSTVRLAVETTDSDDRWVGRIGPDDFVAVRGVAMRGKEEHADCTIRGTASDLYLFLWNRLDRGVISVKGDAAILDLWRQSANL